MDKRQALHMALAAGLTRLEEKHLAQLVSSAEAARDLGGKLPKDLHWSEEMALTFCLASPRAQP
jgi:hypothetical protein